MSLDYSFSPGLEGGHAETFGVSTDGRFIEVPEHRHDVDIDIHRFEFALSRTFGSNLDAVVRVPYFIKEQEAKTTFSSGMTEAEQDAAVRNGFLHHRSETYEGIGDPEVSVGWRTQGLLLDGDQFRFSLGATIPLGATESDPWVLGDAGETHLHIQFGNGTVDPLLDFYYGIPMGDRFSVSFYAKARIPLYENSHGYRGSREVTAAPRVTWMPTKRLSVSAGVSANYLGRSEWEASGVDRNSGIFTVYASAALGLKLTDTLTGSLNAQLPVYNDVFSDEDGLDPGPVFGVSLAISF